MTLEEYYKELMNHITVTEEMRRRILHHIQEEDWTVQRHVTRSLSLRRALCVAACLVLLIVGGKTWSHLSSAPPIGNRPLTASPLPAFQEVSSVEELSEAVGFPIEEVQELPFSVTETHYTAFAGNLAEVKYCGESQSAVYRKVPGAEDPSGDYTSYDTTWSTTIGETTFALKGNQEEFSLANWSDETYSYSLRLTAPAEKSQWTALLRSFLGES